MAFKYEDYAKQDKLEQEIESAEKGEETRREVPDSVKQRFDGKSIDEVLEAYANAEKKISEQGNTIGQLRSTADQLIELQLQGTQTSDKDDTTESVEPISADDLYENPEEAIGKVVERRTSKLSEELNQEKETLRQQRIKSALNEQFEGWDKEIQTEEFVNWVKESPYRTRMVQAADQYDFDAANELLGEWYERKNRSQQVEQEQKRQAQLDAASLETSGPTQFEPEDTFSRYELMKKRIASKQGNRDAEEWLRANSEAIAVAYREGRISD